MLARLTGDRRTCGVIPEIRSQRFDPFEGVGQEAKSAITVTTQSTPYTVRAHLTVVLVVAVQVIDDQSFGVATRLTPVYPEQELELLQG